MLRALPETPSDPRHEPLKLWRTDTISSFGADLAEDPALAQCVRSTPVEPLARALSKVHWSSIGRWRRELTPEQVADVEAEAGTLLRELGFPES